MEQVVRFVYVKDDDRHVVLPAEGECGQVHYVQSTVVCLLKGEVIELACLRMFFRVTVVHAVHAGALKASATWVLSPTMRMS